MGDCRCYRIELVGLTEIATALGVQRTTVDKWRQRHVLPPPTWEVSGGPLWCWHQIEDWANATGRTITRDETEG